VCVREREREREREKLAASPTGLKWLCCLLPGGHLIPVTFSRRTEYARLVIKARLNESERQLSKMRSGLCSVIPEQLLGFMTWEELERRVCGSPEVDLASLKRHTQYRQVRSLLFILFFLLS